MRSDPMIRRWLIMLFTLLSLQPNPGYSATTEPMDQTLELIRDWVQGDYNNSAQVQADAASNVPDDLKHRLMHQVFVPVQIPAIPGYLVFQQSSVDGSNAPDRIIRGGLLQFFADEDSGTVRQRELHFKDLEPYKNAHLKPKKLQSLTLDDFQWNEGCDFFLLAEPSGKQIRGPIGEDSCRMFSQGLNKELIADDEVVISADKYWFLGRFVDEHGEIMWGNASDEHVKMDRVATVDELLAATGDVLIFGATRGTGLETAKLLVARGGGVTAFVRPSSDRTALEALGVDFITGDALNPDEVQAAFDTGHYSAVITTLGCFRCENPPDYLGNKNVFDAAKTSRVARVIMVSTVGAGDSAVAMPWIVSVFLGEVVELKTKAEEHLQASGLNYTIIRPGGLKDGEATGRGLLTDDVSAMGIITRADLAQLMIDTLDDPETIGDVYTAKDADMTWPWDMWR